MARFTFVYAALALLSFAAADTSVSFDGRTFVNRGLIAFGRLPSDAVDSYGETLGGIGSAIGFPRKNAFKADLTGTSSGTIRLNPDRGHNTAGVTDYRARSHEFQISFTPQAAGSTAANLQVAYQTTTLYKIAKAVTSNGACPGIGRPTAACPAGQPFQYTTGLDGNSSSGATGTGIQNPDLPLNSADKHLTVDQEGFVSLFDGALWAISDEYGPYIHFVQPGSGLILASLRPPAAVVPKNTTGADSFTAETQPASGRADNQGFEALTFDESTGTLWAMLQSATTQDSNGGDKNFSRNTRMLGWQLALPSLGALLSGRAAPQAELKYEYVVQLPFSNKGKTYAQSEMHIVDSSTFLVLARDGNGFGDTNSQSKYKQADLISTKGATNIAGTKYDDPANPISPGGVLVAGITPVQYTSFVNLIDSTELAKFGLHNGGAIDQNLIASKLESLAIAPASDASSPDDYLLFVVSDNDFITANGHQAAEVPVGSGKYELQSYADAYAVQYGSQDTQLFVYRVTLPGYTGGEK